MNKTLKSYDAYSDYLNGKHTVKVTFQIGELRGYGYYKVGGNCAGLDILKTAENMNPTDFDKTEGVQFREVGEDDEFIEVIFGESKEDIFDVELEDIDRIIVGVEIVDFEG